MNRIDKNIIGCKGSILSLAIKIQLVKTTLLNYFSIYG